LKLTNKYDWVDQQGHPYLQSSGAEKVARVFGISWRIAEPTKENLEGGHFMYTYTGEFSIGGISAEIVGTRSSKDGFFKKYEWEGEGKDREKFELPPSEIDPGDVKKAAYSNLIVNGVTRLLGIRNLSYEELQEYAGITKEQLTSIPYKKEGKAPSSQPGKAPSSTMKQTAKPGADEPATEPQASAIYAQLKKLGVGDELKKMQKVATILGLAEVPTSVSKITKKQASTVIETLQQEIDGGDE
jgi:hypothetical protein